VRPLTEPQRVAIRLSMTTDRPNAEQRHYWNETAGPKWVAFQAQIDDHIRPFGHRAIDRAAPREGEHLLDVGCGCGETTLDLGRRVGANGSATGVDISAVMLRRAQQRAEETGLRNVRFVEADAQTHAFPPGSFDALYSRFGVMFFADPPAAFANLRRALRPGGRLAFVCWQAVQKNPWMFVPMAAAMQHIALPLPAGADAPGPFAFADRDRVARILAQTGFVDVEIEETGGHAVGRRRRRPRRGRRVPAADGTDRRRVARRGAGHAPQGGRRSPRSAAAVPDPGRRAIGRRSVVGEREEQRLVYA